MENKEELLADFERRLLALNCLGELKATDIRHIFKCTLEIK